MSPAEAAAHEALYRDFAFGGLSYIDAVDGLQKLGYSAIDAEQVVSEWADALEQMAQEERKAEQNRLAEAHFRKHPHG